MKLNVIEPLKELDGTEIVIPERVCEACGTVLGGVPLNLRLVFNRVLGMRFRDEESISGEETIKRYDLALRIQKNDEVELDTQEAALLQKLIVKPGTSFSTYIVAQAWKMLDGE